MKSAHDADCRAEAAEQRVRELEEALREIAHHDRRKVIIRCS